MEIQVMKVQRILPSWLSYHYKLLLMFIKNNWRVKLKKASSDMICVGSSVTPLKEI